MLTFAPGAQPGFCQSTVKMLLLLFSFFFLSFANFSESGLFTAVKEGFFHCIEETALSLLTPALLSPSRFPPPKTHLEPLRRRETPIVTTKMRAVFSFCAVCFWIFCRIKFGIYFSSFYLSRFCE